jgi:pimeloyl-ACP methyl ester carboxylesterase
MNQLLLTLALSFCWLGIMRAQVTPNTLASSAPAPNIASLGGKEDVWLGFERHTFQVDGCECWLVEPKTPLPGNHWVWWMMFPTAFPERTGAPALLAKGYYYAYMSVGDTFGSPSALAHLDAFYKFMTGAGLRSKVALVGLSRGGLYAYNWAARNPEKVSVIYGDAPACNFASWPYAHGDPKGASEWKKLLAVYGFTTNAQALECPTQPIKEMEPLAAAHIPIISVVGDADTTVPYAENTSIIEQEYKKLGGEISVIHKPGCNHHPHGLPDPTPVVDFIVQHDQ